jgi:hypothetical protein
LEDAMTLQFFDVGWQDRVKFRAKFVRRHPSLKAQLFFNRMKAATTPKRG